MSKKAKKVICAMSGGVDSSLAAALLKKAGFNVIGVFMKFWTEPAGFSAEKWNRCCSPESETKARKVAGNLKIPFYVFNFEKEFKKKIVDYFLKEYKANVTPNPCVVCNKEIKFGLLLEKALKLEADLVATGHYARLVNEAKASFSSSRLATARRSLAEDKAQQLKLLKGRDKEKDQSYFLWQLNQRQLGHIMFPVGNYTKKEVRSLAKSFKLPVLDRKESQEICFVPDTVSDFLSRQLRTEPGKITDRKGKILGRHSGLYLYTIGQRKGIRLPQGPYYVLGKDLKKNLLIVTKNEKDLLGKELKAKEVNWISGKKLKFPLKVKARIRYGHKEMPAVIKKSTGKNVKVVFAKAQRAITPGQSVAFYKGQELLGGGIIC
ncbi:MAG: tRNA 2-thiouridine(34) synthase MnmA [bacterium]|nr:tRNA 2-thiouridine(34) synthase MnmA [bacterium]